MATIRCRTADLAVESGRAGKHAEQLHDDAEAGAFCPPHGANAPSSAAAGSRVGSPDGVEGDALGQRRAEPAASVTSACMIADVPMSQMTGSPALGKPTQIGLVPKRPSVAPCGATQGDAFEAMIDTSPRAAAISA